MTFMTNVFLPTNWHKLMMRKKVRSIGIDILEINRIRSAYEKYGERFLQKIFTPFEIDYCQKHKDPYPRFAARFCAKEAVAKALGTGFGAHLSFQDIEIRHDEAGRPIVFLSPKTNKFFKKPHFHLSISHCKEHATAMVMID